MDKYKGTRTHFVRNGVFPSKRKRAFGIAPRQALALRYAACRNVNYIRLVIEHFQENAIGDLAFFPFADTRNLDITDKCLAFFFLSQIAKRLGPGIEGYDKIILKISADQLFDGSLAGIQNIDTILTMVAPKGIFQVVDENADHYLEFLFRGIVFDFRDGNMDRMVIPRSPRSRGGIH